MVDFTRFSHHHVMKIKLGITFKGIALSTVMIVLVNLATAWITKEYPIDSYLKWGVLALLIALGSLIMALAGHMLLYRQQAQALIRKYIKK